MVTTPTTVAHLSTASAARGRRWTGLAATVAAVVAAASVGALATAAPAAAATGNPSPFAGSRHNATRLPFSVSGTASVSVDPATRNVEFSDQLLTLPGVTADVPVVLVYNSQVGSGVPSAVTGTNGSGWSITGFDQRITANADGSATYQGPGGLTGVFAPAQTSGSYYTPNQFRGTLVKTSSGWTYTEHVSQTVRTFTMTGRLSTVKDRAGNTTTFTYTSTGLPASVVASRGASSARTLTVTTSGGRITGLSQTAGTSTRRVGLAFDSYGALSSITDTAGAVTKLGSDGAQHLLAVTAPAGGTTSWDNAVTQITQTNTTSGSPGQSVTRLYHVSGSQQVLVADPTTDPSVAVPNVAHTTYTLTADGTNRFASATDPDGHTRAATYTSLHEVASTTPAAGGATTFNYGANAGESLTSAKTAGGATSSASYGNSGTSQYLPSSTSDDGGNAIQYSYDGAGNPLSTAPTGGQPAKLTYNGDGTAATSASPGAAAGVVTRYGYDATHQLSSLTPVSGSSLGARAYTSDGFGRLSTATDGRGNTTTYRYDGADRIISVTSSNANTVAVSYSYDGNGRVTQRVDAHGTTTYTWDQLGHLLSTANTAGGGTISYRYDTAGALVSQTDTRGTTTYAYDPAHQLTSMTYPAPKLSSGHGTIGFANDPNGRRTDTWLATNADHSVWAAHTHLSYDSSGRVTRVISQRGPATSPTTVEDQTTCYAAGSTPPSCSTTATADRSKLQWTADAVSGETTTYTYDSQGRLTRAGITGGSSPRAYAYTYDPAGNRLTATVTGTGPSSQSLSFNSANQITTAGFGYDGAGDLTTRPTASGTQTATYNGHGQRTATTGGSTTTTYNYGGVGQAELLSQTTAGGDTYSYAYGRTDASGVPQIEQVTLTTSSNATYHAYVAHDPSGSPVALQTSTGTIGLYVYDNRDNPVGLITDFSSVAYLYRFDPYGGATTTQNSGGTGYPQNPYVFAGGLQDRATSLIRYGARWYDPTTGTWTQQDTLNAPLDPANANRYTYVGDDPINRIDPTGASCLGSSFLLGGSLLLSGVADVAAFASGGLAIVGAVGAGGVAIGAGIDFGQQCGN